MANLTRWSLYELEQIAKRKGYDIDRLRNAYWDEMVSLGQADSEGSVRREALKSRVFEQPIEAPQEKAPWWERIVAPAGSQREAGLEGLAVGMPTMAAKAGEFFRDIPAAAGRLAGLPGPWVGEELLTGSSELIEDQLQKIREKAAQAPVSRPESLAFKAGAGAGQIGGELLKMAPYLTGMGPIAGFAAAEAVPAYAEGQPVGHVITEGAKGAALGAGFEAASMLPWIYRLPAMGAVSAALPALKGASPGEIATAGGIGAVLGALGPKGGARMRERIKGKPESRILPEETVLTPEEQALAALRESRPSGEPPVPPAAPPTQPPAATVEKYAAIPQRPPISDLELIERQNLGAQAGRASQMGLTPEELAAQDALAMRGEIIQAHKDLGIEPPVLREPAPPVEPPAVAPQAPQTGVPTKGVPPGREGERGFITLDMLLPMRGKKAQGARAVDEARAQAGEPPIARPFEQKATKLLGDIDDIFSGLGLSRKEEILLEQAENVAKTGTLEKAVRKEYREELPRPQDWYQLKFSVKDVEDAQRKAILVSRNLKDLQAEAAQSGDVAALKALKEVRQKWHGVNQEFARLRKASGESVRRWQLSPRIGNELELIADTLDDVTRLTARRPIYTEIGELVKKARSTGLEGPERDKLVRDLVDAWRLNLFSVSSFTLDLIGNAAALASETAGWAGQDLYRGVFQKDPSFINLRSAIKGMKGFASEARAGALPEQVQTALGRKTASGEFVGGQMFGKGQGTFTERTNFLSKKIDQLVGAPLYMKGAVDTGFKRLGAWAQLYKEAELAAKKANVHPKQQREWMNNWIDAADEATVARAVAQANRLGFNRKLSLTEESIASNTMYKLFGAAFGRWPFQFTRALGEWIGVNPQAWKAIKAGNMEALAGYITKSAAGITGLTLLANGMYDNIDFKTMEYVHPETGNRTRISGREPLATTMVLAAALRGDWHNVQSSIKYASLPFASILGGEGGLLWNLTKNLQKTMNMRDLDPKAMEKEVVKTFNRLIPGQALLAAVKTVLDPTAREGLGAEIPGISLTRPAKIDPTTGEPMQPRQKVLGVEIPQIAGVPIPGGQRLLDPVSQLLGSYGMLDYRLPRRPVVGMPASNIPAEWQRKWYEYLGKEREAKFKILAPALLAKRKDLPYNTRLDLIEKYRLYEQKTKGGMSPREAGLASFGENWQQGLRIAKQLQEDKKIIQKKDSEAAKAALIKLEKEMRRARRTGG